MLKLLSAAVCLVLVTFPAVGQTTVGTVPSDKDKMVCKRVAGTGWRLSSSKVCKTKAEWTAITRETRKEYRDYGRTGSQGDLNPASTPGLGN